jgi:phosphoenolpyruvate carboxykinase (ATP)
MQTFYENIGLSFNDKREIHINSSENYLIQSSVQKGQGRLAKSGALVVNTGKHTGRSARDKYIVMSETTKDTIWWENTLSEMSIATFGKLKEKVLQHLNQEDRDLFIQERSVGAHNTFNWKTQLVTTHPHHALFSKYLFRDVQEENSAEKSFTILHAPELVVDPKEFNTHSGTVIATCFDTNTTIIVGTLYAGEIKKSMFSVLNYLLPEYQVLPMHTGANKCENGEVSLFFGLSGTGKTTLSTDEGTLLIGDDEHGMGPDGVFNFEGGCYAKTYKLSQETEPGIYQASTRFGGLLENVVLHEKSGEVDYFDKSITENGRSSYPLRFIDSLEPSSTGPTPKHVFFLCADAFAVLPPVAKLTHAQAMFYFVLGYTAKLAGTEIGVTEPQATFSSCFGAPFMMRHPGVYAELLNKYLKDFNINVWLVNTGWAGSENGPGARYPLHITREIIRSIQSNKLNSAKFDKEEIFGLEIPSHVDKIPNSLFNPSNSWGNKKQYAESAQELAKNFHKQMKQFGDFYTHNIEGSPLFGR